MSTDVPPILVPGQAPVTTSRRSAFARLTRDPQAVITGSIVILIVLLGILAPLIAPYGPNDASLSSINLPAGSPGHPLGTDANGRDIYSRLLFSINTATISALIGASIAVVLGTVGGLIGGYFERSRGVTEWGFTLIMTFPGILLLILLMPVTGGDYRATMAIFGVLLAPGIYRIVRNVTVGVSKELYVDAARVSGLTNFRILGRHVLSMVRGPIIIATAFLAGTAIAVQSGLAFLGVGSIEVPSFGAMIGTGFKNLYVDPLQYVWPALALGILTASLVLFGNALRDTLEGARPKPAKLTPPDLAKGYEAHEANDPRSENFVSVVDLGIAYRSPGGELKEVVHGVELAVRPGETLGLVGESGSGKTQTAFAILGVLPPEAVITRGSIFLDGKQIIGRSERDLRKLRGSTIAYIPQEPMSNLDPVYTVGHQLVEGIRATEKISQKDAKARALSLLARVGIPDPKATFASYPHQISGGMAQRVLIAGAVATKPQLLIADEPTTALDVTVQAEILDLLRDLQQEMGMGIILVTHNFGVVADICDRVAVMRGGEIVEIGNTRAVFADPKDAYTRSLLDAILDESSVRKDAPDVRAAEKGAGL